MLPDIGKPRVIVVGAGLGGLAAAIALSLAPDFQCLVLEAAPALGEIGAGIQLSPNATRILRRWGCDKYLIPTCVKPESAYVRRWQSGELLQERQMNPNLEARYGAPYYHMHRADLHFALLQRALDLGVEIRTNSKVVKIDCGNQDQNPSVTLETGETLDCAFIIGADGIKSTVREEICGSVIQPQLTGDLAYRFTISTTQLKKDKLLSHLVESPSATSWWGPGKHVVGYMLRHETIYNVIAVFPDDGSITDGGRASATLREVEEKYTGWDPIVSGLIRQADPNALLKWTLMDLSPLSTWIKGRAALIGDACHPMLPYLAQGSAQAIEDAATLAICLQTLGKTPEQALKIYQSLRHRRATKIQQYARAQRERNHLPDGELQKQRDAEMKGEKAATDSGHAWKWDPDETDTPPSWIDGLYAYDAEEITRATLLKEIDT